jgi:O-antigen/teichoic acid export membrane protein
VSVARGSVFFFASSVISAAGFFVAALLIARNLGPAGRGTVAFVTVSALVIARVVKVGIGEATSVLAAQRPEARAALLSNLLAFSLLCAGGAGALLVGVLLAVGAEPAGLDETHLVILLAAIVAAGLVDDHFLIGCGRLREAATISASGGWLYAGALLLVLASVGLTVDSALLAWVGAHLVWAGVLAVVGWRAAGRAAPDRRLLGQSVRFGVRAWLGSMSMLLNARVDQILLGIIASDVALGLYAVAVNGAEVLLFMPTAVATALLPAVAREHGASAADRTVRTFRAASVLTAGSAVAAAAIGWFAIPLVFGEDFRGSVEPFMWLLPGALGYAALSIFSNSLLAARAPGLSSTGSAVALGAGVALDLALIPAFGASGAAAAASAAFLAGGATAMVLFKRTSGFAWREFVPGPGELSFLQRVAARTVARS